MNANLREFTKGIFVENPTFVIVLGLCPTLAITNQAVNGLGMGVAVIFVLAFSNLFISLLRNFIPNEVRIPAYIMVIAAFNILVQLLMRAFTPELNRALGIFIPLIVVNCIILGRAEAFAGKNRPLVSVLDGLGMGLGFTLAVTVIGLIREILGAGRITFMLAGTGFKTPVFITDPAVVMVMAPGGFIVMGCLLALIQFVKHKASGVKKLRHVMERESAAGHGAGPAHDATGGR